MIVNELNNLYADYQQAFDGKDFLTDRLIFDDFQKFMADKIDAVVLGEAPGKDEYEQEIPFIGQAGQNLRNNIKTDNIWITNTIKFRPVFRDERGELNSSKNRTPDNKEIIIGSDYLRQELELLQTYMQADKLLILGLTGSKALASVLKAYLSIEYTYKVYDQAGKEISNPFNKPSIKLEDLLNKRFFISVFSDIGENVFSWTAFVTYHPSPLNYNVESKRVEFLKGVKEFNEIISI